MQSLPSIIEPKYTLQPCLKLKKRGEISHSIWNREFLTCEDAWRMNRGVFFQCGGGKEGKEKIVRHRVVVHGGTMNLKNEL